MAHLPLYVNRDELKSAINLPEATADADINRALGASSRAVEKLTSRRYWQDAADVTHRYTALSTSLVVVDDLTSVTTLSSNGSEIAASDFYLEPANNIKYGEPYLWIESDGAFSLGRQSIEIVGKFGWPEVPDQVKQIVIVTAVKMLKRTREAPWGIIETGFDGMALRIVREDPDMMLLIDALMRAETRRG